MEAEAADDTVGVQQELTKLAFRVTAPCSLLTPAENLAIKSKSYSEYRLNCALSGVSAADETEWGKQHAGWFTRPVSYKYVKIGGRDVASGIFLQADAVDGSLAGK